MLVMVLKPPVLGFLVVSWRHPIGLHFVVVWWGSLAPGAVLVVTGSLLVVCSWCPGGRGHCGGRYRHDRRGAPCCNLYAGINFAWCRDFGLV